MKVGDKVRIKLHPWYSGRLAIIKKLNTSSYRDDIVLVCILDVSVGLPGQVYDYYINKSCLEPDLEPDDLTVEEWFAKKNTIEQIIK